jgi:hypothetical protein
LLLGAVIAAEEPAVGFESMADDAHLAVFTDGREPLDGTLKAVECVSLALLQIWKALS